MSSFKTYKVTDEIFHNQEWSSLRWNTLPSTLYESIYIICDNDKRIGSIGDSSVVTEPKYLNSDYILEICFLEVHPDYRRQGIATSLINLVFTDYPKHGFVLDSTNGALPFYAKTGFKLLYQDMGDERYTLIKSEIDFNLVINELEVHPEFEHVNDVSRVGCIWDSDEARFVNENRTYKKEIQEVIEDYYVIRSVKKQTEELQILSIKTNSEAFYYITTLCSEARKIVNPSYLWYT